MERIAVKYCDVPMPGWPGEADCLRIAHLSDLHLRRWDPVTRAAQRLLMSLEYDLLAVTGDFGDHPDRWQRAAELAERFFAPLQPRLGTYAVLGNHDSPRLADGPGLNLTFLRNDWTTVRHADAVLTVAGVEQTEESRGDLSAALTLSAARRPVVLLAHYPSTVHALPSRRVGLMLAGHTHGGQIRLPLLGCIWAHDRIPTSMARGLHMVGTTHLHVSAGIGVSRPFPVRVLCPPEVSILTLRPTRTARESCFKADAPAPAERAKADNSVVVV